MAKLIEQRALAGYFNELLGEDFYVDVNSSDYSRDDGKTVCVLQLQRMPFAIEGVDSESMNISLGAFAVINNDLQKDKILNAFKDLCGYKAGVINVDLYDDEGNPTSSDTYKVKSFLEFQRPLGTPEVGAAIRDTFILTGTLLCAHASGGAVMSNDVVTEVWDREPSEAGAVGGVLATLSVQCKINKAAESVRLLNKATPQPRVLAHGATYAIQSLYLSRAIDADIVQAIESAGELEKVYYVRRTTASGATVTTKCLLLDGYTTEQAGAYMSYMLSLQEAV